MFNAFNAICKTTVPLLQTKRCSVCKNSFSFSSSSLSSSPLLVIWFLSHALFKIAAYSSKGGRYVLVTFIIFLRHTIQSESEHHSVQTLQLQNKKRLIALL